jgi:oxygen-independent coproporphyrinogen-3 oxidase
MMLTPMLSLYVHFPWCVRKCPYCDFNSHPIAGDVPETMYVDRLLEDLERDVAWAGAREVQTIFLGGGTPSLFGPDAIGRLLDGVRRATGLAADAEVTLEANPGAVDRDHFAGYRQAGVNRLSIGAQSFDPAMLLALGRIHGAEDTAAAVDAARSAGFATLNLDVMHGLPQQRVAGAVHDLERALALGPTHVSWYQLTLEPKTPFAANPPPLPEESELAAIEAAGFDVLASAGLERYEISAFSRPGAQARHNLNYWQFGDYLGIGAGAHGKITFADDDRIVRTVKPLQPRRYLATETSELRTSAEVPPEARIGEFMLNALRLIDGVPSSLFEMRTGLGLDALEPRRTRLIERGLMREDRIGLTPFGLTHLDTVVSEFL